MRAKAESAGLVFGTRASNIPTSRWDSVRAVRVRGGDAGGSRAVDYFVYRTSKEIGALAAELGGIDGLVFTAGIGKNSPEIRERICASCAWLGVEPDMEANLAGGPRISAPTSRALAWVISTSEESVIARHTGLLPGLIPAHAWDSFKGIATDDRKLRV